jgi:hypothetical protein
VQPAPAYAGPEPVVRLAPGSGRVVWVTTTRRLLVLAGPARCLRQLPLPRESLVPVPGTEPQLLVSPNALYELDEAQGQLRERRRWLPDPRHTDSRFAPQLDSLARPCEWLAAGQRIRLREE